MDRRDIGVLMIISTYIILAVRTIYSYILEGVVDPINLYHVVASDPTLFLINLVLYLGGAYILVTLSAPEVRDIWINILFFIIPTVTIIFILFYLLIFGGVSGFLMLYGTSQFPLYHIILTIFTGILILSRRGNIAKNNLIYASSFIAMIVLYGLIRIFYGISAIFFFLFLIIAGILSIFLTKKIFE